MSRILYHWMFWVLVFIVYGSNLCFLDLSVCKLEGLKTSEDL